MQNVLEIFALSVITDSTDPFIQSTMAVAKKKSTKKVAPAKKTETESVARAEKL